MQEMQRGGRACTFAVKLASVTSTSAYVKPLCCLVLAGVADQADKAGAQKEEGRGFGDGRSWAAALARWIGVTGIIDSSPKNARRNHVIHPIKSCTIKSIAAKSRATSAGEWLTTRAEYARG